ncbi:hypothetical protein [Agarilytica rhodophyticola]|uniref:hypothetical protein n=1 Tax=Agarilytica rhodophyticola TaxID=1737490 RepID=UPI000B344387|nr:hypothetical protein [Agarilytica rhodophyticola]
MTKLYYFLLLLSFLSKHALAQVGVEFNEEKPHHLSVLTGGSYIEEKDDTFSTVGIDYEYRVDKLLGLGSVVEQTFGDVEATTVLAVADIHVWYGLIFQVGPGVEFVDDETFAIGRAGVLYEVEFENEFTISPQLHYDLSSSEDTVVFGIALGKVF